MPTYRTAKWADLAQSATLVKTDEVVGIRKNGSACYSHVVQYVFLSHAACALINMRPMVVLLATGRIQPAREPYISARHTTVVFFLHS